MIRLSRFLFMCFCLSMCGSCLSEDETLRKNRAFVTFDLHLDDKTMNILESEFPGNQPLLSIQPIRSKIKPLINDGFFVAFDNLDNNILLYVEGSHGIVLNNNEKMIFKIINDNFHEYPMDLESRYYCQYILMLRFFPESLGYIGGDQKQPFSNLDDQSVIYWMQGAETDKTEFLKYAKSNPVFDKDENNNTWKLHFYVIRYDGGVDLINSEGSLKPFSVMRILRKEIKPKETFSNPMIR